MRIQTNPWRTFLDRAIRIGCVAATILALIPLASLLIYVTWKGASALNLGFFTELPKPVGEPDGGFGNAIVGTLLIVGMASAIAVPSGILAGVYLAEFGGGARLGRVIRFCADVLSGVPSIAVGLFVYATVVLAMGHFSAFAGGCALAILMLPTVIRATEEILALVPRALRESALALGAPSWRVGLQITLKAGAPGIATGVMLAIARAAGESAPLLFTAFGSQFWSLRVDKPIASLPVQLYTFAISPYDEWHRQAFAGALVLVGLILFLSVGARLATRERLESRR